MRHPQARKADRHAADAHERERRTLVRGPGTPGRGKRPVAVAQPVAHDRDRRRHDLRDEWARFDDLRCEHGEAQPVEDGYVDDESDPPDKAEAQQLREQRPHATPGERG